ncbi:MAG: bifunctional hydroxymethylpyrimidine kinase/phosphomethylpyrimidine kinase [Sphaerochaetaceae bacterium]|nr:bifunctional hydroxymethylpyrimidine kinase/phosphomethylpyrimidine kinase [Sphaerochaetaceae bacterium]
MKKVLTIAGSDCSGGAGIQADIKTMVNHNVYAMSVITALTAQNTQGVYDILNINKDMIKAQIDAIFTDIIPDAIKIGMVSNSDSIITISECLKLYNAQNIVLDPVMVATSNGKLIEEEAISTLINHLIPLSKVVTPNLFEASVLSKMEIKSKSDMEKVGTFLHEKYNVAFLIKGGHLERSAADFLISDNFKGWFESPLIDNKNTHGTGCTLSSAIASNLAKGESLEKSVSNAKKYLTKAIEYNLNIGKGRGPLYHNVSL